MFIWQGIIENATKQVQITFPIPRDWLKSAAKPHLHLVTCWHPPVNAAVTHLWACRKIAAQLRPKIDADALRGKGQAHVSYPVIDRTYDLEAFAGESALDGDTWFLELSYNDIGEYYVGQEFSPQQKVAFAAELYDAGPFEGA